MQLQSIYRIYRPQTWDELVGQETIVRILQNEIKNNAVAHAFLFTGPRGVGKTTSARLLARALNCEARAAKEANPCGDCASCAEVLAGRSLDVMEIDAASHTGVDNVRENIIAASRVAPSMRKNKVFIIDEVHMLSVSAFNALLKTLEEPPANVYFILATTEVHKVPETIISRCQRFDFRRVSTDDIVARLASIAKKEKVTVDDDVLRDLARAADGGMRDAESMLGALVALGKKKITRADAALVLPKGDRARADALVRALAAGEVDAAMAVVHDAAATGVDMPTLTQDCLDVLRQLLLDGIDARAQAETPAPVIVTELLRRFLAAQPETKRVDPPTLPLELLIVEFTLARAGAASGGGPAVYRSEATGTPVRSAPAESPVILSEVNGRVEGSRRGVVANEIAASPRPSDVGAPRNDNEKATTTAAALPTLDMLRARWADVLETAKKYNHSLALIFKMGTPVGIEDKRIIVGFEHSFHVDRLRDHANQDVACRVLGEVYGAPVHAVQGEVRSGVSLRGDAPVTETTRQSPDPVLSTILDAFGGTVVQET